MTTREREAMMNRCRGGERRRRPSRSVRRQLGLFGPCVALYNSDRDGQFEQRRRKKRVTSRKRR